MNKTLMALGGLVAAGLFWFGYFWLDERHRWGQAIAVPRRPLIDPERCRRAL